MKPCGAGRRCRCRAAAVVVVDPEDKGKARVADAADSVDRGLVPSVGPAAVVEAAAGDKVAAAVVVGKAVPTRNIVDAASLNIRFAFIPKMSSWMNCRSYECRRRASWVRADGGPMPLPEKFT